MGSIENAPLAADGNLRPKPFVARWYDPTLGRRSKRAFATEEEARSFVIKVEALKARARRREPDVIVRDLEARLFPSSRKHQRARFDAAGFAQLAGLTTRKFQEYRRRGAVPPPDGRNGNSPWWTVDTVGDWLASRRGRGRPATIAPSVRKGA